MGSKRRWNTQNDLRHINQFFSFVVVLLLLFYPSDKLMLYLYFQTAKDFLSWTFARKSCGLVDFELSGNLRWGREGGLGLRRYTFWKVLAILKVTILIWEIKRYSFEILSLVTLTIQHRLPLCLLCLASYSLTFIIKETQLDLDKTKK